MSNKVFTNDEVKILRANPYTYLVTNKMISFTLEFKEMFWRRHTGGELTARIFADAGYDPEILGCKRMGGFVHTLKRERAAGRDFHEGARPAGTYTAPAEISSTEKEIRELKNDVEFLKQEIEFLKKISSPRNTKL